MKRIIRSFVSFSLFLVSVSMAMAVTITTVSKEVGKEGGAFSVNTGGSGTWTATTTSSWITLNRASGNAGVSCIYIVDANFSADTRTGTIDIAGNTFTVYQTGYDATLSPTSGTVNLEGGSGTVEITVDAGVSWTAKANVSWLSVTPTFGTSVGMVTYTVAAYTNGTPPRRGTLTIAGKTFTVTQTGSDVILSPMVKELGPGVGTFNVSVAALAETRWIVKPNASWISIADSGRGYGNDTLLVAVGANPSALPRTGTVSIGSKLLTVIQAGTTTISLSITPTSATAASVGAYGNVAVYSTPDAPWIAESRAPWITISDGGAGAGNGNTKYVVAANPELENRTGRIAFKKVPVEPDDEVEAGRLLYIPNDKDIATGKRVSTVPLGTNFDGTFDGRLTGEPLPQLAKNDWSFSFRFRVGELGAINRLMTFLGNHAVYSDAENVLWFDGRKTSCVVDTEWQHLIFCQDEKGHVRLYSKDSLVAEYDSAPIHDFTAGATDLDDTFIFGATATPSKGYLKNGQFADLQLWGRALTETEIVHLAEGTESRESMPTVPVGMTGKHFRCNQNGFVEVSSNSAWTSASDFSTEVTGWTEFPGRNGIRQRAMRSDGTGTIVINDVNLLFPGSYVVNNGSNFPSCYRYEETYTYDWYGSKLESYRVWPWPITSGPYAATYNFWIYLDHWPSSNANIFVRSHKSGPVPDGNTTFGVQIDGLGHVCVNQNDSITTFSEHTLPVGQWKMLTFVGKDRNNFSLYLDGEELGMPPPIFSLHIVRQQMKDSMIIVMVEFTAQFVRPSFL